MDLSYLEKQVSTIAVRLHELFDEIGIPNHERDSREAEMFSALSQALQNHVLQVTKEKQTLIEEANTLVTEIRQMRLGLDGTETQHGDEAHLEITVPLRGCVDVLKEQHQSIAKAHSERFEQIRQLAQAIESYASHLEPSFSRLQLPPTSPDSPCPPSFDLSHAYFASLDDEFSRVYNEYERRLTSVKSMAADVIQLWAELGTPQAQTDPRIVALHRDAPEQLGLHSDDLTRLTQRRDRLVEEKKTRERRVRDLRTQVQHLWERLAIDESEQKQFVVANRGCSMRVINEFEDELMRLNELKRQNLGLFIEEARLRLQRLWDGLYFSEEEMLDFTPAFSDVYSDALLSAHEAEIDRLTALQTQRSPVLTLIEKHRTLVRDRDELAASSQDSSRLMLRGQKGERRDPGKLLREEKMRKRIAKELPKIEQELRKALNSWEMEYGRPFLVMGDPYLDNLECDQGKEKPVARCKTPSAATSATIKVPTKPPASSGSARNGTIKKAPPPRSKTPIDGQAGGLAPRSAVSVLTLPRSAAMGSTMRSPTRIPARVPLGSTHGNHSPERRDVDDKKSTRSMAPPRLPPPKMKPFFTDAGALVPNPSGPVGNVDQHNIVRHIEPEDVYDDRADQIIEDRARQYSHLSSHPRIMSAQSEAAIMRSSHSSLIRGDRMNAYAMAPPCSRPESRQISVASSCQTTSSTISGSENWETFDDEAVSECSRTLSGNEVIHSAQRKPNVHASYQTQPDVIESTKSKRPFPENALFQSSLIGKKPKGILPLMANRTHYITAPSAKMLSTDGSEVGWVDDDRYR